MTRKILIVDDEPDLLEVTTFRLKKNGYDVIVAADGQKALEIIEKDRPDLILLDLRLPGISGYDICRKLKSDDKFKHIPIVLFTASTGSHITDKMKDIHADGYLIKPFDSAELLKTIKKFAK